LTEWVSRQFWSHQHRPPPSSSSSSFNSQSSSLLQTPPTEGALFTPPVSTTPSSGSSRADPARRSRLNRRGHGRRCRLAPRAFGRRRLNRQARKDRRRQAREEVAATRSAQPGAAPAPAGTDRGSTRCARVTRCFAPRAPPPPLPCPLAVQAMEPAIRLGRLGRARHRDTAVWGGRSRQRLNAALPPQLGKHFPLAEKISALINQRGI